MPYRCGISTLILENTKFITEFVERGVFFEAYKQSYRVKIQEVVFKKSVCSSTDVSKSDFSKQSFISECKQKKKKNPKLCTKLR